MMWSYHELDNGNMCEAKVYRRPSGWGINDSRISKLNLYRPVGEEWELIYEYDRGSEVGTIDDKTKEEVLAAWPYEEEEDE